MTLEESHVILAARNVYYAGRNKAGFGIGKEMLMQLANAVAKLELSERIARNTPSNVVRKLRLVK
jgi:hypothetical protein